MCLFLVLGLSVLVLVSLEGYCLSLGLGLGMYSLAAITDIRSCCCLTVVWSGQSRELESSY